MKEYENQTPGEEEVTDAFLLEAEAEEIARRVTGDEEHQKRLIPFIEREKEKLESAKKRGGPLPQGFERLVLRAIRIIITRPDIYLNYPEDKDK